MAATIHATVRTTLPADDAHPYRSGAWRPNVREWDAPELEVVEGAIPDDLVGVYLRNTENPVHESIGRYHPFDGDGVLHQIAFGGGQASYRSRFVRTAGFLAEQEAAESLWTGMLGHPEQSKREDGWGGARGRMKDASSTDVVCHNGQALTSFWQCGDLYAHDPRTLEPLGTAAWADGFPSPTGISAHPKLDERTGELLVFGYGKEHPFLHVGLVSADGRLTRTWDVELPSPRLPHDLAFTEHYVIVNDLPLYWDPDLLAQGIHLPRWYPDQPSRFGLIRRDGTEPVRWFEADPTYVLHWINAYEDGDEVVLDGFFQHDPSPAKRDDAEPHLRSVYRYLDLEQLQARPHRWRFDLRTGQTREAPLSDRIMEFGMINGQVAGRHHRYSYDMTGAPGWFLFDGLVKHDVETGREERYAFGDGVFGSETPFAPRPGATAEDDGYLVTFTTDVPDDRSDCLVFDATDVTAGPIARVRLPERISSGTHSCWVPEDQLPS